MAKAKVEYILFILAIVATGYALLSILAILVFGEIQLLGIVIGFMAQVVLYLGLSAIIKAWKLSQSS